MHLKFKRKFTSSIHTQIFQNTNPFRPRDKRSILFIRKWKTVSFQSVLDLTRSSREKMRMKRSLRIRSLLEWSDPLRSRTKCTLHGSPSYSATHFVFIPSHPTPSLIPPDWPAESSIGWSQRGSCRRRWALLSIAWKRYVCRHVTWNVAFDAIICIVRENLGYIREHGGLGVWRLT